MFQPRVLCSELLPQLVCQHRENDFSYQGHQPLAPNANHLIVSLHLHVRTRASLSLSRQPYRLAHKPLQPKQVRILNEKEQKPWEGINAKDHAAKNDQEEGQCIVLS